MQLLTYFLVSFVGLNTAAPAMNKWPETVDETEDDDAFTWNEPPSGEGGTEGRGFTPDKHNLLRDLETVGVLSLLSVVCMSWLW